MDQRRGQVNTTNATEPLNTLLRKTLKSRGALPDDDAARKLLFLSIRNATSTSGGLHRSWHHALLQFAIHFERHIPE